MVPDLEKGGMIGLMSSKGLGLVTEIKDLRQLLLPDEKILKLSLIKLLMSQ